MKRFALILAPLLLLLPPVTAEAQLLRNSEMKRLDAENARLRRQKDSLDRIIDSLRAANGLLSIKDALEEGNDEPTTAPRPMDFTPEQTDSLLALWYRAHFSPSATPESYDMDAVRFTSEVSDEEMMRRLSALNPYFSLPFNDIVKNYMILYSEKRAAYMPDVLGLAEYYFPIFEEALRRYSLPLELKYLAVVESKLKNTATSRAGACGIWQFMYRTARSCGLEINSYIDERFDVEKASDAAARYLRDLYAMLGDWPLAVSAYNCGAGNVNKAIRKAGGKRDFWSVYEYLPRETRGYMPAFVGVMYAFEYSREYGIFPAKVGAPAQTDTFEVRRNLHFKQISEVVGVPLDDLRFLNPKYYNDIIPGSAGVCTVTVPYSWSPAWLAADPDSLYRHKASEYLPDRILKDIASGAASSGGRVEYKVKSGDTLSGIASRYHTSVKQLKQWNHLRSDALRIGQIIYIYR